jgi:hypothetical protein
VAKHFQAAGRGSCLDKGRREKYAPTTLGVYAGGVMREAMQNITQHLQNLLAVHESVAVVDCSVPEFAHPSRHSRRTKVSRTDHTVEQTIKQIVDSLPDTVRVLIMINVIKLAPAEEEEFFELIAPCKYARKCLAIRFPGKHIVVVSLDEWGAFSYAGRFTDQRVEILCE